MGKNEKGIRRLLLYAVEGRRNTLGAQLIAFLLRKALGANVFGTSVTSRKVRP